MKLKTRNRANGQILTLRPKFQLAVLLSCLLAYAVPVHAAEDGDEA